MVNNLEKVLEVDFADKTWNAQWGKVKNQANL